MLKKQNKQTKQTNKTGEGTPQFQCGGKKGKPSQTKKKTKQNESTLIGVIFKKINLGII